MRVYLQTLGCRLNEAELEAWTHDCHKRGLRLAADLDQADLVIINTCAVTGESVRKSRQLIRRARRSNPHAKLVVSGCLASLEPQQTAAESGIDLLVPNADKEHLIEIVAEQLALPVMPEVAAEPGEHALLARGRHRAFIKVQDGCRYQCSFCIVTKARGAERSRPVADVVAEINRIHATGVQEVVLAGVHLGGYCADDGRNLADLIAAVLEGSPIPRIRLGSLEPWELSDDFWRLFHTPRLMPHLHLPLQSGADSVLRRMSRRCRTSEFRTLVADARAQVPHINITTDIIVGFPGENEVEWEQTMAFAEKMEFAHIHIFAYSPRAGTKAAAMRGQVSRATKRARSQALHTLAQATRSRVLAQAVGRDYEVLFESLEDGAAPAWSGYTPNYLRVTLPNTAGSALENRIVRVRATKVSGDAKGLLARVC